MRFWYKKKKKKKNEVYDHKLKVDIECKDYDY